jgi:hypothetical protein
MGASLAPHADIIAMITATAAIVTPNLDVCRRISVWEIATVATMPNGVLM